LVKYSKLLVLIVVVALALAIGSVPIFAGEGSQIEGAKSAIGDPTHPDDIYLVGMTVEYLLRITNTSTSRDMTVDIWDIDPSGTYHALANGQIITFGSSWTAPFFYTILEQDLEVIGPLQKAVRNRLFAEGTQGIEEVSVAVTKTVQVVQPEILVTKTPSHLVSKAGDIVSYTIYIENTGDHPLENITVIDDLLGDLSAHFPDSLDIGENASYDYDYTVKESDPDPLLNEVVVEGTAEGFDPSIPGAVVTDSDVAEVDLIHPALSIEKWANKEVAKLDSMIDYYVRVCNTGDVDLIVLVNDTIGGILFDGVIPMGDCMTFDYDYIVTQADVDAGTLFNTATATGTLHPELNLDNVIGPEEATFEILLITPKIEITKTADPTQGYVGDEITYTVRVENIGDYGLENIVVMDTMFGDITAEFGFNEPLMPGEFEVAVLYYTILDTDFPGPIENFVDVYANPVGMPNDITDEDYAIVEILEIPGECYYDETAWAFGGPYANPNWDYVNNLFWGWTNGPLGEGSYEWDIYAGAGQNDLWRGVKVGKLYVDFFGDCVTVKYEMGEVPEFGQVYLGETHLWVGLDVLPQVTRGRTTVYTNAPGQFPEGAYFMFDPDNPMAGETEWEITLCGFAGEQIYVAAHSVVWIPMECPEE